MPEGVVVSCRSVLLSLLVGQEEHSPRRRRGPVRLSVERGNKGTCVAVKMETRNYLHK